MINIHNDGIFEELTVRDEQSTKRRKSRAEAKRKSAERKDKKDA